MSLSQPRSYFGIHSLTPYSRLTKKPYGMARVLETSTFKLAGALVELKGGSNRYTWQVEDGDIKAELAFSMSEYPDWVFSLFGGKTPTVTGPENTGAISTIANVKGTSIVAATGILATGTVLASGVDLKRGRYTLVAVSATALDLYCNSDVDFGHGAVGSFLDDSLVIAHLTGFSTGATKDVTGYGIEFTGGASATAFQAGDTASFEVRPPNFKTSDVVIGGISDVFTDFGVVMYGQKAGDGRLFEIEAYKVKAIGLGLGAARKVFGKNDYTALASYDSVENAVARVVMIDEE